MHYYKLLAISLFIISCSANSDIDDMTPSKDVITEDSQPEPDYQLEDIVNTDTLIILATIEGKTIQHNGYELIIGESTKEEYDNTTDNNASNLIKEAECAKDKRIVYTSYFEEIDLRLTNGDYFTLKKESVDEQFMGYQFIHYDTNLNIYVLWENWHEAGHPIMVNATTGKITSIYGETFASNKNQTLTANVAADIGAGWTPNGIQVFEIQNDTYYQLFEFDPVLVLNENWGPVDLKWATNNTIIMECITHDGNGGYLTLYKVIQFKKID